MSNEPKPPVPSRKDQPVVDPVRGTVIHRNSNREVPTIRSLGPDGSPVLPSSPPTTSPGASTTSLPLPQRPTLARGTTAVQIVDEAPTSEVGTPYEPPSMQRIATNGEQPRRANRRLSIEDDEGLTLADLPQMLEAEHAKELRRGSADRQTILLSELTAWQYFVIKHAAAIMVASEGSPLRDVCTFDELLDIIDARKNTFWGKLFKGSNERKNIKKKGTFACSRVCAF